MELFEGQLELKQVSRCLLETSQISSALRFLKKHCHNVFIICLLILFYSKFWVHRFIYFLLFVYLFIYFIKKFILSVFSALISLSSNSWRCKWFVCSGKWFWKLHIYTSCFRTSELVYFGIFLSFVHFLEQMGENDLFYKWLCSQISAVGNMLWSK